MWQSLLVCNAFPEASTGGTGLSRPFLLQIDTFGKWLRYPTNVCYVKLKKLRYLDKLRWSESGGASDIRAGQPGTAPTLHMGTKNIFNGDPILSEMGTQWGPSTAEIGTQKAYIWKIDRNEVILWHKEFFCEKIFTKVCHYLVHSVCPIHIE